MFALFAFAVFDKAGGVGRYLLGVVGYDVFSGLFLLILPLDKLGGYSRQEVLDLADVPAAGLEAHG